MKPRSLTTKVSFDTISLKIKVSNEVSCKSQLKFNAPDEAEGMLIILSTRLKAELKSECLKLIQSNVNTLCRKAALKAQASNKLDGDGGE